MYLTRILVTSFVITALIAACAACTATPPAVQPTLPHSVLAARNAIRATVVLLDVNNNPNCAGTFVGPTRILTAMHCVRDQTHWAVRPKEVGYVTYDAWQGRHITPEIGTLLRWDEAADTAVVEAKTPGKAWVTIGKEPEIGSQVFSIGHPDFNYYTVAAGFLSVRRLPYQGGEYHKAVIAIRGGSSGCGLYDAEWHLIGVASHMDYSGAIGYFALPEIKFV